MARKSQELEKIINIFEEEDFIDEKIETMNVNSEFIMCIKENVLYGAAMGAAYGTSKVCAECCSVYVCAMCS